VEVLLKEEEEEEGLEVDRGLLDFLLSDTHLENNFDIWISVKV